MTSKSNLRWPYALLYAGAMNYKLLPVVFLTFALSVMVAIAFPNYMGDAVSVLLFVLIAAALAFANGIVQGLRHYDKVGPETAGATLAASKRAAQSARARAEASGVDQTFSHDTASFAPMPLIEPIQIGGITDDDHRRMFDDHYSALNSGPSVNIDGTPMFGGVDANGHVFGQTD